MWSCSIVSRAVATLHKMLGSESCGCNRHGAHLCNHSGCGYSTLVMLCPWLSRLRHGIHHSSCQQGCTLCQTEACCDPCTLYWLASSVCLNTFGFWPLVCCALGTCTRQFVRRRASRSIFYKSVKDLCCCDLRDSWHRWNLISKSITLLLLVDIAMRPHDPHSWAKEFLHT